MDKQIERYETILTAWLETFISHRQHLIDTEYTLVTDTVHHHFQVVRTGWMADQYLYKIVFHFQIKPTGKIWILVNNTDLLITDDLITQGIPMSDIVIGFLPDSIRAYSGFAVV